MFPTLNYPRNIETEVPDIAQCLALERMDGRTDGRTLLKLRSRITLEGSEIEKKFIVENVPFALNRYKCYEIIQGYIAVEENYAEVRVR